MPSFCSVLKATVALSVKQNRLRDWELETYSSRIGKLWRRPILECGKNQANAFTPRPFDQKQLRKRWLCTRSLKISSQKL